MIEVENLTKNYGPKVALTDVSFSAEKGEILGLLGPNAAGKTTTMRILTGFMPPTSGTARISGYDVVEKSLEVRKRIGYLPETAPLYPEMSVRDYLVFMAKIKGVERSMLKQRLDSALEKTATGSVADTLIGKLSKGYRQRVGLAQALIHNPDVLILDEPTVGLDPKQIRETRALIKALGGEHTVILSTHILPEVSMTCSRVVIISGGKVMAVDTPDGLMRMLKGSERVYMEVRGPKADVMAKLKRVPRVLSVDLTSRTDNVSSYTVECELEHDLREQLAAAVTGSGWGLLELRPISMSLEDVFLKLTTEEEAAA
jgi:ABC-2 type transport system ATP-binding protein